MKKDYTDCRKVNVMEVLQNDGIIPSNYTAKDLKAIRLKNLDKLDKALPETVTYKIPAILHIVWVTNKNNPTEIQEKYLEMIANNLKILAMNKNLSWKFNLWVNDISLIPHTTSALSEIGFTIKQLEEEFKLMNEEQLYQKLCELTNEKYYALVSNIIRYVALEEYGGIYLDTDYELFKVPYKLMKAYDFVAGSINTNEHSLENNVILTKPHHPIMKRIVSLSKMNLLDPENAPERIHHPCSFYDETVLLSGSPVLAPAFYSESHKDGNIDIIFDKKTMTDDWRFKVIATPPEDAYSEDYNSTNLPLFGRDHYAGRWFEH